MKNSLDIVVRFSSLGDVVLCAGFIEKLKSQTQNRVVFASADGVRDIIGTFAAPPSHIWSYAGSSLSVFFKTLDFLNAEQSQNAIQEIRVFDLHGVPKSFFLRLAARFFAIKHGITFSAQKTRKKSFRRWLTLVLKKDVLGKRYIYAEHQKLLAPATQAFLPHLRGGTAPLPSPSILVAPDSQHWKKRWPVTHWEAFFRLAETALPDAEFTLVGGHDIFPRDMIEELQERLGERFRNRLGRLPLSDLAGLAAQHQLTLCGNSAWQHISEAVGVPVISLPGPIIRGFGFSPFLFKSRELEVSLNCRPCTRHGGGLCHRTGDDFHACMRRVTPELLLKHTKEMLQL